MSGFGVMQVAVGAAEVAVTLAQMCSLPRAEAEERNARLRQIIADRESWYSEAAVTVRPTARLAACRLRAHRLQWTLEPAPDATDPMILETWCNQAEATLDRVAATQAPTAEDAADEVTTVGSRLHHWVSDDDRQLIAQTAHRARTVPAAQRPAWLDQLTAQCRRANVRARAAFAASVVATDLRDAFEPLLPACGAAQHALRDRVLADLRAVETGQRVFDESLWQAVASLQQEIETQAVQRHILEVVSSSLSGLGYHIGQSFGTGEPGVEQLRVTPPGTLGGNVDITIDSRTRTVITQAQPEAKEAWCEALPAVLDRLDEHDLAVRIVHLDEADEVIKRRKGNARTVDPS